MRQLTTDEREIKGDEYGKFLDTQDNGVSTVIAHRAFTAGFIAGLEYQDKRIEALEAFIAGKITRDELEQVTK